MAQPKAAPEPPRELPRNQVYHLLKDPATEDEDGAWDLLHIRKDSDEGRAYAQLSTEEGRLAYMRLHKHESVGQVQAQWHFLEDASRGKRYNILIRSPEGEELDELIRDSDEEMDEEKKERVGKFFRENAHEVEELHIREDDDKGAVDAQVETDVEPMKQVKASAWFYGDPIRGKEYKIRKDSAEAAEVWRLIGDSDDERDDDAEEVLLRYFRENAHEVVEMHSSSDGGDGRSKAQVETDAESMRQVETSEYFWSDGKTGKEYSIRIRSPEGEELAELVGDSDEEMDEEKKEVVGRFFKEKAHEVKEIGRSNRL